MFKTFLHHENCKRKNGRNLALSIVYVTLHHYHSLTPQTSNYKKWPKLCVPTFFKSFLTCENGLYLNRTVDTKHCISCIQARSQKFAMGGLFGGSGGGAPSRRRLGVWGQSPQPPEARGSGGGAPSA